MSRTFQNPLRDGVYCAALAAAALLLVLPWRPEISYDNFAYYYPAIESFAEQGYSAYDIFVSPFYIPDSGTLIQADQSKPVFIGALRIWSWLCHVLQPSAQVPGAGMYQAFMFFSCWLMAMALVVLGGAFGRRDLGMLTAALVMVSPWHLIFLYYPAYTQFSFALFAGALICLLRNTRRSVFFGGVISTAALLSNTSLVVYLAGLCVLTAVLNRFHWERAVSRICLYLLGLTSVFVVFEIGKMIMLPLLGYNPDAYLSPLETLVRYFHRSLTANHFQTSNIPKLPGMLGHILGFNSMVISALMAGAAAAFGWQVCKTKLGVLLRPGFLLLVPVVVAIGLIDFGPGVQLGRSYFIAYPLMILAALFILSPLYRRTAFWNILCAGIAVCYALELAGDLSRQRAVFHAPGREICEALVKGQDVAMLESDAHRHAMVLLAAAECGKRPVSGDITFVTDISATEADLWVTGPLISTVWHVNVKGSFRSQKETLQPRDMEGHPFIRQKVLPFFGLYPLILFEDEMDSFRYFTGEFAADTFADPVGGISTWRMKQ